MFPDGLGFLESIEREPLMAILYAYFDESGKKSDHPVVTVASVCATQARLQQFDDAWNVLLRHYGLASLHMARASRLSEKCGPKMPKGQSADERMDALTPFAECINKHLEYGLIKALDINGFNALAEKLRAGLGDPDDPYYLAFIRAMLELDAHTREDDRISLICDDDTETAWDCYRHYRSVRRVHDKLRKKTIALSFADDEYFPALQASDMVAFLSRLEAKSRFYRDRYSFRRLFEYLTTEKGVNCMKWGALFADEAKLLDLSKALPAGRKK